MANTAFCLAAWGALIWLATYAFTTLANNALGGMVLIVVLGWVEVIAWAFWEDWNRFTGRKKG